MKRLIKKIKAETTPRNRFNGQVSTLVSGILITISSSGIIDNKPVLKSVFDMVAGALILKARGHALKSNA